MAGARSYFLKLRIHEGTNLVAATAIQKQKQLARLMSSSSSTTSGPTEGNGNADSDSVSVAHSAVTSTAKRKAVAANVDLRDSDDEDCEVVVMHTTSRNIVASSAKKARTKSNSSSIETADTFLSFNVWFREDLAVRERMAEIIRIVRIERPTVIAFQEVTRGILSLLAKPLSSMGYHVKYQSYAGRGLPVSPSYFVILCALRPFEWCRESHFQDSQMSRCLLMGKINPAMPGGPTILVGTTHLESPLPPFYGEALQSKIRKQQLAECFTEFTRADKNVADTNHKGNVSVLLGDLNWDEGGRPYKRQPNKITAVRDGKMEMPASWRDAWSELHPSKSFEDSCTFHSKKNAMLVHRKASVTFRPDRILFSGAEALACKMVGCDPIAGVFFEGKPVLPSDHFGLLATLQTKSTTK